MLPSFLITALFALGGVCFILCTTTFHYFRDRVDGHTQEKMTTLFSSQVTTGLVKEIKKDGLPATIMKDFVKDLFKIGEPRRRLLRLLLFFPVAGGLFVVSASLASIITIENELIVLLASTLELLADLALLSGIIFFVYCGIQLVKLARELA